MTPLDNDSKSPVSVAECASALMDVAPLVMRVIRKEIRNHRPVDLSVPQFRALAYVGRYENVSVSDVAEHLGLTLPSTSKTVDALVRRGLLDRTTDPGDRRRWVLELTAVGTAVLEAAQKVALEHIALLLGEMSGEDLGRIFEAMQSLRPVFMCKVLSK